MGLDLVDSNGISYKQKEAEAVTDKAYQEWADNTLEVSPRAAWKAQDARVKEWYSVSVALREQVKKQAKIIEDMKQWVEKDLSIMNEMEANHAVEMLNLMELLANGVSSIDTYNIKGLKQFSKDAKAKIAAIKEAYINGQDNSAR